jgi:hypothetical protein
MASSDSTVTARDVLRAVADVRRRGPWPALEDLEHREPDLAEFVLEDLTALHDGLRAAGVHPRKARRLVRRCQAMAAVIILSLRDAHARLWADEPPGGDSGGDVDDRADGAKAHHDDGPPPDPGGPKGGA